MENNQKDLLNITLDEYGRAIISNQELLAEISGAITDISKDIEHDSSCGNGYCGHVLACHNTSCSNS